MPWPVVLLIVGAMVAVVLVVYRVLNGSFRLPEARSREPRRMITRPPASPKPIVTTAEVYATMSRDPPDDLDSSPGVAPTMRLVIRPPSISQDSPGPPTVETGTPRCPSCFAELTKRPSRKTKCPHCGEFIMVKYTPTDRVKRLVTPARADEIENEWAAYQAVKQRHAMDEEAAQFGIPPGLDQAEIMKRMKAFAKRRSEDMYLRKVAAILVSTKQHGRSRRAWEKYRQRMELEELFEAGFREVELRVAADACPSCQLLGKHRRLITEVITAIPVPNESCHRWKESANCCARWMPYQDWRL